MKLESGCVALTACDTTLVLDCELGDRPSIIYWGRALTNTDLAMLKAMATRQHAPGGPDVEIGASLLNETGAGLAAGSGFSAHRDGRDWATLLRTKSVTFPQPNQLDITAEDTATGVRARHLIDADPETGLMRFETQIQNIGETPLSIDTCAAICLPMPASTSRLFGFSGRWANEFQIEEVSPFTGAYVRENKRGRTSHDSFPGLLFSSEECSEQNGDCYGLHLGWSGNHRLRVDRLSDGRCFAQMGELFLPGEVCLAAGETYCTPQVHAGFSATGFTGLSQTFHQHLRGAVLDQRARRKPRPVHYNTWEAVYFDHDRDKLFALVDAAADVGAERFILDDGWFGARRNDKSGLGDWVVSDQIYPDGLGPLIAHVKSLGMEFGLWFEPEMVNPDSDLYRANPDWVLQAPDVAQVPFRHQYVLDLTRPEVSDYLFARLDALLREYQIDYIKWDMNRDIHHPGSDGRPAAHRQVHAVYALIDRLRRAHPSLEIESCSSGGGRADYGILQRTDRIWTSDSNDALDRQHIQRGASYFFPLEVMGAHVGPARCHITGRKLRMELRVATALFGHMGLELDLLSARERDLVQLKAGIALHKQHRPLLHAGNLHRLDTPSHVCAMGVVAQDRSEALWSWCNLTGHKETLPGRLFAVGLDPAAAYRVRMVWPDPIRTVSRPSIIEALDLDGNGAVVSGEALMMAGLQIPLMLPETCLIYHFERE